MVKKNQIVHIIKYTLGPASLSPHTTLFNSFLGVSPLFLPISLNNMLMMLPLDLFIQSIISYCSTKHSVAFIITFFILSHIRNTVQYHKF